MGVPVRLPTPAGREPSKGGMDALTAALRHLRQQPSFTVVTTLVLGLGVATATAVFSVVDAVVLRPLPFASPDRLVTIWDTNPGQALSHDPISPVNFMDQRALPVFDDAAAWWRPGINLTDAGRDPARVNTIETSANLFRVLGVSPQLGAGFPAGDALHDRTPAIVISDRLWRDRYAADAAIIGRPVPLNGRAHVVLGVMPPGFHFPDDIDVWQRLTWDLRLHSRQAHFMEAVARLSDGTTLGQAQAAVDALWTRLEADYGETRNSPGRGWGSRLIPLIDEQLGYFRPALLVLLGAVGLLLLITVLNVASLLIARALARAREMAVRAAIGASPRQLVRQLMAESVVLSGLGATVGLATAAASLPAIIPLLPVSIPRLGDAGVNARALAAALAIVCGTTLVFGLVPASLTLRRPLADDLRSGGRGSSGRPRRAYAVLVGAEVALACALLVGSALLVRSVERIVATPIGVQADDTVTTSVQVTLPPRAPGQTIRDWWLPVADVHARMLDAVRGQPGIEAAGATNFLPLEIGWRQPFVLDGQAWPANTDDAPHAQLHSVSDGYFEAMGAEIADGRAFAAFDGPDAPGVLVVNESFARRHLPRGREIGAVVRLAATGIGPLGVNLKADADHVPGGLPFEVVGIVRDVRNVPLGQATEPALYTSTRQFPFSEVFIAVRARDREAAVAALRAGVRAAAPQVPVGAIRTWGDRLAARSAEPRLLMALLICFGGLAGGLAALGVYGLFSWAVSSRTRELAIRLTLGARPRDVGARVLGQGLALVGVGMVAGVAVVQAGGAALRRVLFEVAPSDPVAILLAAVLLLAASMAACLPAALRAMRVNPAEGLQVE